jgi:nitrous oxidase accessory protein
MRTFPFLALFTFVVAPVRSETLHVGPGHPFLGLRAALAAAGAGDSIVVHGGVHREGTLLVDKPLTLVGVDWPQLDGGSGGDLLVIAASHVTVRGFTLQNGGTSNLTDVAAIKIANASQVTIEDNRIVDCGFGVHLSRARDCAVRRNEIDGARSGPPREGNGIHTWSCERLEIADNGVSGHRDGIYLDFTTDSDVTRNTVAGNLRYGLHFMFSHRNAYRENTFLRNGAGVAVMYSREVRMEANRFSRSWGSAAYGLLLKDISDSQITGNTFEFNSTAVTMQNSNRVTFTRNQFRENGWALQVQSSCADNAFLENNFLGNSFDLATNGQLELNRFEGNYWDRAEIFDRNRDGVGDVPHRPLSLFAMLVERIPASLLLLRSPLVHFLDRVERVFPTFSPDRLLDDRPAMRPHALHPGTIPLKQPPEATARQRARSVSLSPGAGVQSICSQPVRSAGFVTCVQRCALASG